ncbi:hypothetical protein [Sphingomonas sanxanigenens]|uniref:Uncharacterized protein n=1 Tax=Sphingomonas sanxanigenens DSM 19645 = NX02 TaxID=1123269 RepID=W0AK98_9SPHN|nr:hypothetical protein [Sphingomonas sanxanigenens]AHE56728.1 hypothetical protein NX02_25615 [Sphingomonas sanxanigenens DSM 19645 = NX02]
MKATIGAAIMLAFPAAAAAVQTASPALDSDTGVATIDADKADHGDHAERCDDLQARFARQ